MTPQELLTEAPDDGPDAPRKQRRRREPDLMGEYAEEQIAIQDRAEEHYQKEVSDD